MHRRFIPHQRKRLSNKKKALTRSVSRTAKKPMTDVSVKSCHEGGPWDVRAWIGGSELPLPESSVLTSVVDMVRSLDKLEKGAVHQLGVFWRNLLEREYPYRTSSKTVVQVYSGWEGFSRIGAISVVSEIQTVSFQGLHCASGSGLYTGVDRVKCSGEALTITCGS